MKRTRLIASALLGITMHAVQAGSVVHVSEILGSSPGAATGPIPVVFSRNNDPIPTFALRIRVAFDPALSLNVSTQGLNGATCTVNLAEGYVFLEIDGGDVELASTQYCGIFVDGIIGGLPEFTELPLVPISSAPDFLYGGCFGQNLQPVECAMLPGSVLINHTDLIFRARFDP